LDGFAATLRRVPPNVVAAPFVADVRNEARLEPSTVLFYGPAVLALLLQHVGVTFGSLSLVRERLLGATEIFAVAPISSQEILVGKYVAYVVVSAIVAVALMALMYFGLHVPIFGPDPRWLVLGQSLLFVLLLIVASLGLGFLISAVSASEHQAVQLSMLVLLASVFFGGLFLPLASIIMPIRLVAYILPVTYGIGAFQSLMLRGQQLPPPAGLLSITTRAYDQTTPENLPFDLLLLVALSVGLFLITGLFAHRQLKGD
jgi:ABC-2 type transport system permease protein